MINFKNSNGKIVMTEKDNGEVVFHDMKIEEKQEEKSKDEQDEKNENSNGN